MKKSDQSPKFVTDKKIHIISIIFWGLSHFVLWHLLEKTSKIILYENNLFGYWSEMDMIFPYSQKERYIF